MADADLAVDRKWVNSLLSDRVRANVRIGGKLNGK